MAEKCKNCGATIHIATSGAWLTAWNSDDCTAPKEGTDGAGWANRVSLGKSHEPTR